MSDSSPHAIDQTAIPRTCEICGTSLNGITSVDKRCSPCFWHRIRNDRSILEDKHSKLCAVTMCPFDALPAARYCYAHTVNTEKTKQNTMHDPVNHPSHYCSHPSGIECIAVTEHMNFNVGNAIKYLWRESHKNGIEDLKKAAWYINREIQRLEAQNAKTIP